MEAEEPHPASSHMESWSRSCREEFIEALTLGIFENNVHLDELISKAVDLSQKLHDLYQQTNGSCQRRDVFFMSMTNVKNIMAGLKEAKDALKETEDAANDIDALCCIDVAVSCRKSVDALKAEMDVNECLLNDIDKGINKLARSGAGPSKRHARMLFDYRK